jgi:hypothetical protein
MKLYFRKNKLCLICWVKVSFLCSENIKVMYHVMLYVMRYMILHPCFFQNKIMKLYFGICFLRLFMVGGGVSLILHFDG